MLARYLDNTLQSGEKVILLVKPIPPELVNDYLQKTYRQGGDAGPLGARGAARLLSSRASDPDNLDPLPDLR